jgi:hypothetical protein
MNGHRPLALGALLVVAAFAVPASRTTACAAAEEAGEGKKLSLRVLYVGHPDTDREKDYVGFLEKHFAKVGKGDLKQFQEDSARDYDVVVFDYDGDSNKAPRPKLSAEYSRPTLTIGLHGARLGSSLKLKTSFW